MTNNIANRSPIALGLDAHRHGVDIAQGGIALMADGIESNWFYSMRWSYGSGDNEVSGICNLGDMFKGRMNGTSQDGKYLPAMYRAVADNFGIDDGFSNADKVAFRRAFTIAAAKCEGKVPLSFVDETVTRKGKSVKVKTVQVPASVAYDLEKDGQLTDVGKEIVARIKSNIELEGKEVPDDETLLARAKALPIKCTGGRHAAFGKLPSSYDIANKLAPIAVASGAMLPSGNRNRTNSDKFVGSVEFVTKCVREVLGDGDEAGFAPSDSINNKLVELRDLLVAYLG